MTQLEQFIAGCNKLAVQFGLKDVLIAARDPRTNEVRAVSSPKVTEGLSKAIQDKLGIKPDAFAGADDSETSWPGT
jgi:hypothetical protein